MAKRKNNHYHYAEKFDDKRRKQRRKVFIPRRTAFVTALFLLLFGLISTTFAAYVSSEQPSDSKENSIIIDVRTAKSQKDIAVTGGNVDLAASGYNVTSGAIVYFDTTGWDTATNSCVQVMIGHNTYSNTYDMTRVGNTNLYYISMPSWSGFTQLCFIATTSHWGEYNGQSPSARMGSAPCYTNTWGSSNLTATKYVFRADLSSNGNNLSCINDSNYNTLLNSTFNLYAATKKGTGTYSASTDGGNATLAGTTKTTTDATSTSAFSTATSSANPVVKYPMIGTTVTLSNSKKTGYKFDDYVFDDINGSNTTGNEIPMTSWKNETTNAYARFSEVMHNVKITTNTSKISGSTTNACVGVATAKSISAPTKNGYTFLNWDAMPTGVTITSGSTTSSTISIKYSNTATTAQTVTLKANYKLNAPTGVSIDNKTMSVGGSAVSLNPQLTSISGLTYTKTYTIVNEAGTTITDSSIASVNSSGQFTASVPGIYTVTYSVTASDGTLTSDPSTSTKTVTVYPAVPAWTLTMSGYDSAGSDPNSSQPYGSEDNPYLVTLGSNFSFTAAITTPLTNYVYTWYNGDGVLLGTGSSLTFGAASASEATSGAVEVEVYCIVSYTGVTPTTTTGSAEVWYYIKSLIKSFEIPDLQKIYATPNDAKMDIEYNIPGASGYETSLWFSPNNSLFYKVDSVQNSFLGTKVGNTDVYRYDPATWMYPLGVKYFRLEMSKSGASAKTDIVHTTVGTKDASATRSIYFINNIGSLDLSNYRLMAFYIDGNGDMQYQTAQDVYKGISGHTENLRFRVSIPSDATKISFAVARKTFYEIPADATTAPDYDVEFFYAFTNYVTLTSDANTIKANTATNTSGDNDNPLYRLTTQYLAYQTSN